MFDLMKLLKEEATESMKKKTEIIGAYKNNVRMETICRQFRTSRAAVKRLINAYEDGDEQAFRDSKIGCNTSHLLIRPLTATEKRQLHECMEATDDIHLERRCQAVLLARDYRSYRKLADAVGMSDHKMAKEALDRFLLGGVDSLKRKKSGPAPRTQEEVQSAMNELIEIGDNLWIEREKKTWVTGAEIAQAAGCSEGRVQHLLRGKYPEWRCPASLDKGDIAKLATDLGWTILNLDDQEYILSDDRIKLQCKMCNHIKDNEIFVKYFMHRKPMCRCHKHRNAPINKTQSFIVKIIGDLLNIEFDEDVTPPFIKQATNRNLRVDGYSHDPKIIVEYQGILHEKPALIAGLKNDIEALIKHVQTIENDEIKRTLSKKHGFLLIEVESVKDISPRYVVPAIQDAFRYAGLDVPYSQKILDRYHRIKPTMFKKVSDRQKMNCVQRILNGQKTVPMEAKYLHVHPCTIYSWLKSYRSAGNTR
jgi:transposase